MYVINVMYVIRHATSLCVIQSPVENEHFLLLLLYELQINTVCLYNELIPSGDFVVFCQTVINEISVRLWMYMCESLPNPGVINGSPRGLATQQLISRTKCYSRWISFTRKHLYGIL